jgi:hypothetical protein
LDRSTGFGRQLAARENMPAWPARFPAERVREYEFELGQYAFAGQYQQSPHTAEGRHLQAGVLAALRRPRSALRNCLVAWLSGMLVSSRSSTASSITWGLCEEAAPRLLMRDVYSRITGKIIADLERGIRPWHKPWNADHAAGRITRPLRDNGIPYKGINVVMLWSAAVS